MLTFIPVEEIDEMDKWEGSQLNRAKEILAYELTSLVHSKEEADKALEAARAIFTQGTSSENMPTTEICEADLADGKIAVVDLMVKGKLAPSKGEAKRLIQQGGVAADDVKVERFDMTVDADALKNGVIIKKGKKVFHKFIIR